MKRTISVRPLAAAASAAAIALAMTGQATTAAASSHHGAKKSVPANVLYATGTNVDGALGTTPKVSIPHAAYPVALPPGVNPVQVSTFGMNTDADHTLLITSTGTVYSAGGEEGGFCHGALPSTSGFTLVTFPPGTPPIKSVATSLCRNYAIDASGHPWGWGDNTGHLLGLVHTAPAIALTPQRLETAGISLPVLAISCAAIFCFGLDHNAATSRNDIIGWGESGGIVNPLVFWHSLEVPTVLPISPGSSFSSVVAGDEFGIATTTTGAVFSWGWSGVGNLGTGTKCPRMTSCGPAHVHFPKHTHITSVGANFGNAFAISSYGKAYAWGSNAFGELGINGQNPSLVPVPVTTPTKFVSIKGAADSVMALGTDNTMYAWGNNGFGELGNVPVDFSQNAKVPEQVTGFPAGSMVVSYAPGYLSSLFILKTK